VERGQECVGHFVGAEPVVQAPDPPRWALPPILGDPADLPLPAVVGPGLALTDDDAHQQANDDAGRSGFARLQCTLLGCPRGSISARGAHRTADVWGSTVPAG